MNSIAQEHSYYFETKRYLHRYALRLLYSFELHSLFPLTLIVESIRKQSVIDANYKILSSQYKFDISYIRVLSEVQAHGHRLFL